MSLSTTAGPGPDEPAIVVQSRRAHTSSLPRPGPFPTSSSRELTQPMVQCKVKAAITTYQRQEKEKCVSSCDSASCSTNGTKVASSPFLIFGTPTPAARTNKRCLVRYQWNCVSNLRRKAVTFMLCKSQNEAGNSNRKKI
ncbi:hypothetical protein VPH35_014620 [Triticum aestivum]|uniref:Uncharacterized protein n=1 Tax=Aegilops tauschii subsp. strangulata TaxID=200361 RepID=A0A452YPT2_AEGTS